MSDYETDYLIVGAGAVGLAFADTLIDEDPACHVTIVDRYAKPGGHWNDAYSFVALHQPSATYGVNSMAFPCEYIDSHGPNRGFHALASGAEVLAYYERVMNMRLLPSGRVTYHRLSEYRPSADTGDAIVVATLSGKERRIPVRRKVVDATFYKTSVPATHTRNFKIADDVRVVPPGEVPALVQRGADVPGHYVVLGAGKTAMDTVVWLIDAGVPADDISWVRPRDSWLWNRDYVQPGEDAIEAVIEMQAALMTMAKVAADSADLMRRMGKANYYLRIDPHVEPTMFHYAVISQGEIDRLRRVTRVLRNGRVTAIENGLLHFADSTESVAKDALFIDCTATAVPFSVQNATPRPIFDGDTIVLQPLQVPLVVLSAAIAAFIEVHFEDDDTRNALATPGPLTDTPETFAYAQLINMKNRGAWSQHPEIMSFLARSRLDLTSGTIASLKAKNSPKLAALKRFGEAVQSGMPALIKLGMDAKVAHDAMLKG